MPLLPLPLGQWEPVCQVKNANELFRHMLRMISVAQECAAAAAGGDNKRLSVVLLVLVVVWLLQEELPTSASHVEHASFL